MKNYLFVFMLLLATTFSCNVPGSQTVQDTTDTSTSVADPVPAVVSIPAFKIVDQKKRMFNLLDFKGKKIFVNLWATWCPPCREEIPSIEKLYAAADTAKVAFILLSLDERAELAADFTTKNHLTIPVYYPAENLPAVFNVQNIPSTFIFDEKGNLIKRIEGSDDYNAPQYHALLGN